MTEFFRGIVKSAKAAGKGFRLVTAIGRGEIEITDAQLWQQRGFASRPKSGDPVLFLKRDGLVIAIGSTTADCPSDIAEGESIVYASTSCLIRVKPNGLIMLKGAKVVLGDDKELPPTAGIVTGECLDPVTGVPFPDKSTMIFGRKL